MNRFTLVVEGIVLQMLIVLMKYSALTVLAIAALVAAIAIARSLQKHVLRPSVEDRAS